MSFGKWSGAFFLFFSFLLQLVGVVLVAVPVLVLVLTLNLSLSLLSNKFRYILNTLIFIISGTIIGRKWADDGNLVSRRDIISGIVLYLVVHLARFFGILSAQACVNKRCCKGRFTSYDFDWRQSVVMWWGGLRAAVGLALALIVPESP